ncbi:MAG: hypothetical protein ACK53P_16030, partial [Pseudanabaena sp.]
LRLQLRSALSVRDLSEVEAPLKFIQNTYRSLFSNRHIAKKRGGFATSLFCYMAITEKNSIVVLNKL